MCDTCRLPSEVFSSLVQRLNPIIHFIQSVIIFYTSIIHYAQLCFNEVIFIFCGVFLDVYVIRRYLPYFTSNYHPTRLFCRIPFSCRPKGYFKQKSPAKESSILCRGILAQQHLTYSTSVIYQPAIPLHRPINHPTSATRNPLDSSMSLHSPSRCIQYTLCLSCCGIVSSSTPT